MAKKPDPTPSRDRLKGLLSFMERKFPDTQLTTEDMLEICEFLEIVEPKPREDD